MWWKIVGRPGVISVRLWVSSAALRALGAHLQPNDKISCETVEAAVMMAAFRSDLGAGVDVLQEQAGGEKILFCDWEDN